MIIPKKYKYPQHSPRSSATGMPPMVFDHENNIRMEDKAVRLPEPLSAMFTTYKCRKVVSVLSESTDFSYAALPFRGKMSLTLIHVPEEESPRLVATERLEFVK